VKPLRPQRDFQADSHIPDPQIVEMLSGMNATADLQAVQRTRRAVMRAAAEMREQQRRSRRNSGFIILAITVLAMIMTPALWSTVDDFLGGEQWFELPGMIMVLVLLLFSTIIAALIISFRSQQAHGRR
jgi:cytochrome bd-type quinol oxidase subunit 2